jgi:hypothetical protein
MEVDKGITVQCVSGLHGAFGESLFYNVKVEKNLQRFHDREETLQSGRSV